MKVVVLSDLHLGAATGTATDDAFVSFLQWLTERAHPNAEPWRLVLLGDLLDLLHPPAGAHDPLAALDAVAARHRSALAALGTTAARGVSVDLVPGNHDSELVAPRLQERLRALVAAAAGTSAVQLRPTFRVRPWFLLLPGLLYAEHGSQYHALNAVAYPLAPFGRWSPQLPPGAVLDIFFGGAEQGARARALPHLVPAAFRALFRHGRKNATTAAALHLRAQESGLSPGALDPPRARRGLACRAPPKRVRRRTRTGRPRRVAATAGRYRNPPDPRARTAAGAGVRLRPHAPRRARHAPRRWYPAALVQWRRLDRR